MLQFKYDNGKVNIEMILNIFESLNKGILSAYLTNTVMSVRAIGKCFEEF